MSGPNTSVDKSFDSIKENIKINRKTGKTEGLFKKDFNEKPIY